MVATMQNPAALPRERYACPMDHVLDSDKNKGRRLSFSPRFLITNQLIKLFRQPVVLPVFPVLINVVLNGGVARPASAVLVSAASAAAPAVSVAQVLVARVASAVRASLASAASAARDA
jgi:hypothetical protein